MSRLAVWFIFELIGVGAASDPSEPQALKNFSLSMMIDQWFCFYQIFNKNLPHSSVWRSIWMAKVEVVPFYNLQLLLARKFATSASTSLVCTWLQYWKHTVVSFPLIPLSMIFDRWLPLTANVKWTCKLFNIRDAKVFLNIIFCFSVGYLLQ